MQLLRIDQSTVYTMWGAALPENGNRDSFWNIVLKRRWWWTKSENKIVSVTISRALLSLSDLLTFEDGTDRLSQNDSKELPLYAA